MKRQSLNEQNQGLLTCLELIQVRLDPQGRASAIIVAYFLQARCLLCLTQPTVSEH